MKDQSRASQEARQTALHENLQHSMIVIVSKLEKATQECSAGKS